MMEIEQLLHKAGRISGSMSSIIQLPVIEKVNQRVMKITGYQNLMQSADFMRGYCESQAEKLEAKRVYIEMDSRDCDHVRVWSVHRFDDMAAAEAWCIEQHEEAEGPTYFNKITKELYDQFHENPPQPVDYLMEAR
jgi:hypothetical protein